MNLGDHFYRIVNIETGKNSTGFVYSTKERAEKEMERLEVVGSIIEYTDTRPIIAEVLKHIQDLEESVWDEYLSFNRYDDEMQEMGITNRSRWFDEYYCVAVYVVTGGSEGMYLHVDIITTTNKRLHVFTGKTLKSFHSDELWKSAGRIAKELQA